MGMSYPPIPKVEEIVERLTAGLSERGFARAEPDSLEAARYEKKLSTGQLEVGIQQEGMDGKFDSSMLFVGIRYVPPENSMRKLGQDSSLMYADLVLPSDSTVRVLFRGRKTHTSKVKPGVPLEDGRFESGYTFYFFDKEPTTPQQMTDILREFIDYIAKYAQMQIDMFGKTAFLDE